MVRSKDSLHIDSKGLDAAIAQLQRFQEVLPSIAEEECSKALDESLGISKGLAHVSHDRRHSGHLKESLEASGEYYAGTSQTYRGVIETSDRAAPFEVQGGADHAAFIDSLSEATSEIWQEAMEQTLQRAMQI